jgi:hypothetical protein
MSTDVEVRKRRTALAASPAIGEENLASDETSFIG